jgi:tetratricopeptide (TPR) repeat protein
MSWKIWKSKEERLREEWNKAINLRNLNKWQEAINCFLEVEKLSNEVSDLQLKELGLKALVLAKLYTAKINRTHENLLACYGVFSKLKPETEIEIPYKAKAGDIAREVLLLSEESKLPIIHPEKRIEDAEKIATMYEKVAQNYFGLGRETLVLSELFDLPYSTFHRGFTYMGLSRMLKGLVEEEKEPGKAVEYYSEAFGYFSQTTSADWQTYVEGRREKMANVMKCWFCGRPVQGEEVHYVYLDSFLTPYLREKFKTESPPTFKEYKVTACKGCYGAIHILSDKIAKYYYEMAMSTMREMEARLKSEIGRLEREIGRLEREIRGIYNLLPR